jgi:malate dehydrogenase
MPIERSDVHVTGTNDYAATANSDIVIITAGLPRKPGMSRDDLLHTNFKIMSDVVSKVVAYSPESILIVVSNPLDAMVQTAYRQSGFNRERVLGMAGILDSGRFKFHRSGIEREREQHELPGSGRPRRHHGPAGPLHHRRRHSDHRVARSQERIDAIVQRTRDGGAEIVKHLKTGSAYYAPSAAAVEMAEAILKDKKKILPCAAYLQGEYGINGYFIGVPCKLGAAGLEKIIEIKLTDEEDSSPQKKRRCRQRTLRRHRRLGTATWFRYWMRKARCCRICLRLASAASFLMWAMAAEAFSLARQCRPFSRDGFPIRFRPICTSAA